MAGIRSALRGLLQRAGVLLMVLLLPASAVAQTVPAPLSDAPLVFAAASLRDVLQEVGESWRAQGGGRLRFSFAGTPALARQLEQGAPADLFVSADERWMAWAVERGLVQAGSVATLLGNRLVLVAPAATAAEIRLVPGIDLGATLGASGRLAIADAASVPAGRYGKAALTSLGAWDAVQNRLAMTGNVRAALALAARGEVPLALVYDSDARREPRVRVVGVFPADAHPPIRYLMALVGSAPSAQARAFHAYLRSDAAARIFASHGFTVLR